MKIPNTQEIFCARVPGTCDYQLYCHDNETPVASFVIPGKSGIPKQSILMTSDAIDKAVKRISDFEEKRREELRNREKVVAAGDFSFIFALNFSEMTDEYIQLRNLHGFRRHNEQDYHPLSKRGKELVDLIRLQKSGSIENTGKPSFSESHGLFSSPEKDISLLPSILSGKHPLSRDLSEDQLAGYCSIAKDGLAPVDFVEPEEFFCNGQLTPKKANILKR